ncbi:MAG TPA: cytochrome C oxidase subunit IV family protein [Acidimicrobiales bacterium]|nr:cytochrome C oxidase subunit IV family protein [Acidimicrobiales bacterium]
MSEISVPVAGDAHPDLEHHPEEHASDRQFVKVFLGLVVVTAVEVAWAYAPWADDHAGRLATALYWGGLMLMMSFKFFIIASYFMHLRFDSKVLTRVFYAGVVLAVAVYLIVLCTFQLFSNTTPGFAP